jgi:L-asparaginase/Glu-tRNA(Gln) amidotransferase subunit D
MIGALVGAADIHAGAAADGFEAFEDLDRRSVVIAGTGRGRRSEKVI